MATIFEKTMEACLESKAAATKTSKKDVKTLNKKMEAKRKAVKEADELDFDEDELNYSEPDFADDVVVVTDPDMSADDVATAGEEAQDIIDNTPDGEQPMTTEHVGDYTYTCPICGNTFFSETEMHEGDECPVCGDTPEDFVLVGSVASPEEGEAEDEGDEDFELDLADKPEDDTENDLDESKKVREARRAAMRRRASEARRARRPLERRRTGRSTECGTRRPIEGRGCKGGSCRRPAESRRPIRTAESVRKARLSRRPTESMRSARPSRRPMESRLRRPVSKSPLRIDEKTFNPYLTKFVRENYKNAMGMSLVGAKRIGNTVNLECKLRFKGGTSKNVTLKVENFKAAARARMTARDDGTFKNISKTAPFAFNTTTRAGIIRCEGMSYNIKTRKKGMTEAKTIRGRVQLESRRPMRTRRPSRRMESRRPIGR